jgi:hypothetical protein
MLSSQLPASSFQLSAYLNLFIRFFQLEAGGWRLEAGSWKLEFAP